MTNRTWPRALGRRCLLLLALMAWAASAPRVMAATGRVIKVLPEFLDSKGRNSIYPSLFERDAYQNMLRLNPKLRSTMRFYVQWKTKGPVEQPLEVRVEMRGTAQGNPPVQLVLSQPGKHPGGWFSHWTEVTLTGKDYKALGAVTAWRVTLWEGKDLLGEQKSFLW